MENEVAGKLLERLVVAARKRRDIIDAELAPPDFEKFMTAVERVGGASVQLQSEGIDLAITGMAMDYYSRAIGYMAAESAKLREVEAGGSA